jgi:hypothetical protein
MKPESLKSQTLVNFDIDHSDENESRTGEFIQRMKPRSHKLRSTPMLTTPMKSLKNVSLIEGQIPEVTNSCQPLIYSNNSKEEGGQLRP